MSSKINLAEITKYISEHEAHERIETAKKYIPEEVTSVIPSIGMSTDGTKLDSVFLVSKNYICELHLSQSDASFDLIHKKTIYNYRFKFWKHEVKGPEAQTSEAPSEQSTPIKMVVIKTYLMAEIELKHTDTFTSVFLYACETENDRQQWINNVVSAIPVTLLADALSQ